MTSFVDIKKYCRRLILAADDKDADEIRRVWDEFVPVAKDYERSAGNITVDLLRALNLIEGVDRGDVCILDHGCGGGGKTLFLMAVGYTNIYGVTVNQDTSNLEYVASVVCGTDHTRFHQIDGSSICFEDEKFHFVFSLQVLEHVNHDHIESFYAEEARVLKPGGVVYHEVPHQFVPFDSHAGLWFAHWAPRSLKPLAYGFGKTIQKRENMFPAGKLYTQQLDGGFLFLRSPYFHYRKLMQYFGNYDDWTVNKLTRRNNDPESYDSSAPLRIRQMMAAIFRLPVVGGFLAHLLRFGFMLQTVSVKTP
ncbi:MAG: class I SAM-dependent methyltransferase [Rhodospirillales bacterium]